MAKINVCVFYDEVDKVYLSDSITAHRSIRSICRGFLDVFDKNRRMNPKEFSLRRLGSFDDETGIFEPCSTPEVIDPRQVFAPIAETNGEIVEQ